MFQQDIKKSSLTIKSIKALQITIHFYSWIALFLKFCFTVEEEKEDMERSSRLTPAKIFATKVANLSKKDVKLLFYFSKLIDVFISS